MISLMLFGAVAGALALGVLMAYGVCQIFFRLMRMHAISSSTDKAAAPVASVGVAGKS
jgi:hypothetical protein